MTSQDKSGKYAFTLIKSKLKVSSTEGSMAFATVLMDTGLCMHAFTLLRSISGCVSLFQGSSACAWWIWTEQQQQQNTATQFKWFLWSQRAALPKITWLWASPCRMGALTLEVLPLGAWGKPGGVQGVVGVFLEATLSILRLLKKRRSWKRDAPAVCAEQWLASEGNPPSLSRQRLPQWPGARCPSVEPFPPILLIVSVGYSTQAMTSQSSLYNL